MESEDRLCSSCGSGIYKNDRFCRKCGTAVDRTVVDLKCTACDSDIPEDASFCSKCGTAVGGTKEITEAAIETSTSSVDSNQDKNRGAEWWQGLWEGCLGPLVGLVILIMIIGWIASSCSDEATDTRFIPTPTAPAKIVPTATLAPIPAVYSGCSGLEDLIPKLALPGSVTLSYWQVVNLGIDDTCDSIIKELNKPENLK